MIKKNFILGHEIYLSQSQTVQIIKIVSSEQKCLVTLANANVPDIVLYFFRQPTLNSLIYTELLNSFTWSYKKPTRFRDDETGYFTITIRSIAKNIYLYKKSTHNPSKTCLEVILYSLMLLRVVL